MSALGFGRRRARKSCDRGAALIELSLVAPLLLTLFLGVMDLGRALHAYIVLSHIAAEGVRSASGLASLEPGSDFEQLYQADATCGTNGPAEPWVACPRQYRVQARVKGMLDLQNVGIRNLAVRSGFNSGTAGDDRRTVSVRITGEFETFLPFLGSLPLRTEKSGPYLF